VSLEEFQQQIKQDCFFEAIEGQTTQYILFLEVTLKKMLLKVCCIVEVFFLYLSLFLTAEFCRTKSHQTRNAAVSRSKEMEGDLQHGGEQELHCAS
jgi:hypothetical protein